MLLFATDDFLKYGKQEDVFNNLLVASNCKIAYLSINVLALYADADGYQSTFLHLFSGNLLWYYKIFLKCTQKVFLLFPPKNALVK